MTLTETTAKAQNDSLSFDVDLQHSPQKVWRALTDPELLAAWLLPTIGLRLEVGAEFTLKTQPYPGWDGTVSCKMLEIEPLKKLTYAWTVPHVPTTQAKIPQNAVAPLDTRR